MRSVIIALVSLFSFSALGAQQEQEKVEVRFFGFAPEIEAQKFKTVHNSKICHLICRVSFFNQFVSQKLRLIDISNGYAEIGVWEPNHLKIGSYWFQVQPDSNSSRYDFIDVMLAHEFAHLIYNDLSVVDKKYFEGLFHKLTAEERRQFAEGPYLGKNFFFLGHPEDNPDELFASAFALSFGFSPLTINGEVEKETLLFVAPYVTQVNEELKKIKLCRMWN